jgi:hypothetical protein
MITHQIVPLHRGCNLSNPYSCLCISLLSIIAHLHKDVSQRKQTQLRVRQLLGLDVLCFSQVFPVALISLGPLAFLVLNSLGVVASNHIEDKEADLRLSDHTMVYYSR